MKLKGDGADILHECDSQTLCRISCTSQRHDSCTNLLQKEVRDGICKEAEMKIKAAVGFRHVIDLLSSEQKLIVGHNCFLGTNMTPPLPSFSFFHTFIFRQLDAFSL